MQKDVKSILNSQIPATIRSRDLIFISYSNTLILKYNLPHV